MPGKATGSAVCGIGTQATENAARRSLGVAGATSYLVSPVLAAEPAGRISPGLLGFMVVAVLGLATFLLSRSMLKQLKKINFDEQPRRTRADEPEKTEEPPTS